MIQLLRIIFDLLTPHLKFDVSLVDEHTVDRPPDAKGPKVYKVRLNKVAEINPV